MQNIIAVNFEVESQGYQAITALSRTPVSENAAIMEMVLVKRTNGKLQVFDSYNSGIHTTDDTARGVVIGGLLGILGGPIGVLLGSSAGAVTGSVMDADDAKSEASMMEMVADKLMDEGTSLIILAEEKDEADLDGRLKDFQAEIYRFDAAVIAQEVEEAEKMQEEMERQTRMKLREAKKKERKNKIEEKRAKIAADLDAFKARFKK